MQCLCELKESETHDLNCFIRALRLDIFEIMNSCKDIYEAYREATCVEYMLRRSHMQTSKSQERKSPQITRAHVVEHMVEDIKIGIEMQEQETKDSMTTSDKVVCITLEKGPAFPCTL